MSSFIKIPINPAAMFLFILATADLNTYFRYYRSSHVLCSGGLSLMSGKNFLMYSLYSLRATCKSTSGTWPSSRGSNTVSVIMAVLPPLVTPVAFAIGQGVVFLYMPVSLKHIFFILFVRSLFKCYPSYRGTCLLSC